MVAGVWYCEGCDQAAAALPSRPARCQPTWRAGIEDHVEAFVGRGGLPFIRLSHPCGSSVEVRAVGWPEGARMRTERRCTWA